MTFENEVAVVKITGPGLVSEVHGMKPYCYVQSMLAVARSMQDCMRFDYIQE